MKKLIATLGLAAVTSAGFAQGTVLVLNTSTARVNTNSIATGGTSGNTAASTTAFFYYEVLTAPSTVTTVDANLQQLLNGPWSDTGAAATNTSGVGRLSGSTAAPDAAANVNNWGVGVNQSFIVVGWSAGLGSTWAQVAARLSGASLVAGNGSFYWSGGTLVGNEFLGATAIGQAFAAPQTGPAPQLWGSAPDAQHTPISTATTLFVVQVPEPSTFALAGLGAAALLIFRRRK